MHLILIVSETCRNIYVKNNLVGFFLTGVGVGKLVGLGQGKWSGGGGGGVVKVGERGFILLFISYSFFQNSENLFACNCFCTATVEV